MENAMILGGRVALFAISLPFILMSYCYFEHAVEFRTAWRTATSGKRRTPPGPSVLIGFVFLAFALLPLLGCFWDCGLWTRVAPFVVVVIVFLILFLCRWI